MDRMAIIGEDFNEEPSEPGPTYCGDGVYARFDGERVTVYISDGIRESNHIYLDPEVFRSLVAYGRRIGL